MVTDRTPPHKRIARAEKSAGEWKMKAIERREEVERLNLIVNELASKCEKLNEFAANCNDLRKQMGSLARDLENAHKTIAQQQEEVDGLKKNSTSRWTKAI